MDIVPLDELERMERYMDKKEPREVTERDLPDETQISSFGMIPMEFDRPSDLQHIMREIDQRGIL